MFKNINSLFLDKILSNFAPRSPVYSLNKLIIVGAIDFRSFFIALNAFDNIKLLVWSVGYS